MIPFNPVYSHGGASFPNWPAVLGTTVSAGRPIVVAGAHPHFWPTIVIHCSGGTATVALESNGAELDASGNPLSSEWCDVSGGGYNLTSGEFKEVKVPPTIPFYRTNITARSGSTVVSYCPFLINTAGLVISAQLPGFINKLPYSP